MDRSPNEYEAAIGILKSYYRDVVKQMAEEIVDQKESFDGYFPGGKAEELIDNYAARLCHLGTVYSNLAQFSKRGEDGCGGALGPNEFRCFSCSKRIEPQEERCGHCGWTWKLDGTRPG